MNNIPKKHFTPEEKEILIAHWKESGQSKKVFAEENGLMYYTFVSWFEKYGKKSVGAFEEIKLPVVSAEKIFAEVCNGKTTIRFFQVIPPEYFHQLIK